LIRHTSSYQKVTNMQANKEALKRFSTYANTVALVVGAMMVYFPEIIPKDYVAHVMCGCSGLVAFCQAVKQGVANAQ
jgi:hypothetical protein